MVAIQIWKNEKKNVSCLAATSFSPCDNATNRTVIRRCSVKIVFLEILQNLQENTCARVSFLIKLQSWGLRSTTLFKKRLWRRCFPVNFVKFSFFYRTPLVAASEYISCVFQKRKFQYSLVSGRTRCFMILCSTFISLF